jgi:hypothetical protein
MPQENGNGFTIEAIAEQIARLTEVIVAGQQADEAWRAADRQWKEEDRQWKKEDRQWKEEHRRWQEEDRQWKEENRRWHEGFQAELAELKEITQRQGESVDRLSRVAEILVQELRQKR